MKLCVLFLLCSLIYLSQSQLQILDLKYSSQDKINFAIANFGFVPYGKQVTGFLEQAKNNNREINKFGCNEIIENKTQAHFVILNRNPESDNCTEVQQALNAYNAGYRMLILVDYKDDDLEYLDIEDADHNSYLAMPVIILKKSDGQKILEIFQTQQTAEISIFFNPPNKQNVIDIELWFDTMQWQSGILVMHLRDILETLGDKVNFQPHFPLYSCYQCEANNYLYPHPDCLGNGRYCSRDPDGSENYYNQKGKDSTREKLRSMCVFQTNDRQTWFHYQLRFEIQCLELASTELKSCAESVMREFEIDVGAVKKCYIDGFYYDDEEYENRIKPSFDEDKMRNYYLEQEKIKWQNTKSLAYPALIVNGIAFRGDITQESAIYEYICQGFIDQPSSCNKWESWQYGEEIPEISYSGHFLLNLYFYLSVFLLILFVLVIVFTCYKRQTKKDIQKELSLQVNSAMSQYWALNEKSSGRIDQKIEEDI